MKAIIIVILLLCALGNNAYSQILKPEMVGAEKDTVCYRVRNDTSKPYLFWVDRKQLNLHDSIPAKELLGRFRQYIHRPEKNKLDSIMKSLGECIPDSYFMSLAFMLTDGNIHFGQPVEDSALLGITYLCLLQPGDSLLIKVVGDDRVQKFYKSRFGSMPQEYYYLNMPQEVMATNKILVIDNSNFTIWFHDEIRQIK